MPQKSWSAEHERQYTLVKDSLLARGTLQRLAASP